MKKNVITVTLPYAQFRELVKEKNRLQSLVFRTDLALQEMYNFSAESLLKRHEEYHKKQNEKLAQGFK